MSANIDKRGSGFISDKGGLSRVLGNISSPEGGDALTELGSPSLGELRGDAGRGRRALSTHSADSLPELTRVPTGAAAAPAVPRAPLPPLPPQPRLPPRPGEAGLISPSLRPQPSLTHTHQPPRGRNAL